MTQATLFDGPDLTPEDTTRLQAQMRRIYDLMSDGQWRTLAQIERATGDPQSSISAQLRHLRKKKHGSHQIDKRNLGGGLWEYRMVCKNNQGELQ